MTDRPEGPDQEFRRVLAAGTPERAPEALLEAVVRRTSGIPQRRPGWASSWLIASGALASATAGLLVVAFLAGFLRLGPSVRTPGASVVPTTAQRSGVPSIPVDGSCQPDSQCLGILPPGAASTRVFKPALQFLVPAGWMNRIDQGGVFELRRRDRPEDVLGIYRHPEAVQAGRMVSGVGESSGALMAFLEADAELTVTSVHAAQVGGLSGLVADIAPAPSAAGSSLDCPGARCVTIFSGLDPAERPVWGYRTVLPADSRSRIYLLEASDGVVLVQVTAWNAQTFEGFLASAERVLESFSFAR